MKTRQKVDENQLVVIDLPHSLENHPQKILFSPLSSRRQSHDFDFQRDLKILDNSQHKWDAPQPFSTPVETKLDAPQQELGAPQHELGAPQPFSTPVETKLSVPQHELGEPQLEILERYGGDISPEKLVGAVLHHVNSGFHGVHYHIEQSKNEILEKLEKKAEKKERATKMLERDPVDFEFYQKIIQTPRRKRERILHHSRFRIAITLLYLTGARANEIRNLTEKEVYNLLRDQILVLHQSKTHSLRKVVLGKRAIKQIKSLEVDIDTVFMSMSTLGGGHSELSWIKFLNKRLKHHVALHKKNLQISSHSFRIGFVTKLLQKLPIHSVKELVNHKSIQTTLRYSRHRLSDQEKAEALDTLME